MIKVNAERSKKDRNMVELFNGVSTGTLWGVVHIDFFDSLPSVQIRISDGEVVSLIIKEEE